MNILSASEYSERWCVLYACARGCHSPHLCSWQTLLFCSHSRPRAGSPSIALQTALSGLPVYLSWHVARNLFAISNLAEKNIAFRMSRLSS